MKNTSVVKQITFPSELLKLAENRARQFGVSIPEYVRHLVISDTKSLPYHQYTPEEEKEILEGIEDYKAGRTIKVRNKKELDEFLDSLKQTPNGRELSD